MADNKITGRAKKFDGTAIDYVSIFNWNDGTCIAQVTPDASGNWQYSYGKDLKVGITYVADGCEPITHGAYNFDYIYNPLLETILHYSFNGNVLDQSVNNLNGIKTGVANFVAGRKAETQALEFVAGCVQTPIALPINSDKVTLSFWMKTSSNSIGTVYELSPNFNVVNSAFFVAVNDISSGSIDITSKGKDGAISPLYNTVSAQYINNAWQHIVIEIDRSLSSNPQQKIYINNEFSSVQDATNSTVFNSNINNYILYIGQRNASSLPFVGKIQDMRVYNRLLTADERLALFNE